MMMHGLANTKFFTQYYLKPYSAQIPCRGGNKEIAIYGKLEVLIAALMKNCKKIKSNKNGRKGKRYT
jgi:hypothetical protein